MALKLLKRKLNYNHFFDCYYCIEYPENSYPILIIQALELFDPVSNFSISSSNAYGDYYTPYFTIRAVKRPFYFVIKPSKYNIKQSDETSSPELTSLIKAYLHAIITYQLPPYYKSNLVSLRVDIKDRDFKSAFYSAPYGYLHTPKNLAKYDYLLQHANEYLFAKDTFRKRTLAQRTPPYKNRRILDELVPCEVK